MYSCCQALSVNFKEAGQYLTVASCRAGPQSQDPAILDIPAEPVGHVALQCRFRRGRDEHARASDARDTHRDEGDHGSPQEHRVAPGMSRAPAP